MLTHTLRSAFRNLRRTPLFSLFAILILALGIGATTAFFTVVNGVVWRPLPFHQPDRLVWIWATRTDRDKAYFSIPDFRDTREQVKSLQQMSAFTNWIVSLTGSGEPERLPGTMITPDAFELLGVRAALGRTLVPDDGHPGRPRVVVLTHGLWQRRFGGDPGIIGQPLVLNGDAHTVVGVLPPNFAFFGSDGELAAPLVMETHRRRDERGFNFLRAFARLSPGATPQQAYDELAAITTRLRDTYPVISAKRTAPRVIPLHQEIVGDYGVGLWLLLGAVGVVLLIVCVNLATLLVVRTLTRQREFAIRSALGCSRAGLLWQVMAENTLLASVGGVMGAALAMLSVNSMLKLAPAAMPRAQEVAVDGNVLAFAVGVTLLAVMMMGILPAWQATKANVFDRLRSRGAARQGALTRGALIVCEVGLCVALLAVSGLLLKTFARVQAIDAGFRYENVLRARVSLPGRTYPQLKDMVRFHDAVAPRLRELPGVEAVAVANVLPMDGFNVRTDFSIVARPAASASENPGAQSRFVSDGYFRALGIPVLRGREFDEHDTGESKLVAMIDAPLAAAFWKDREALGTHIQIDTGEPKPRVAEIVGVVGSVKHFTVEEEPLPTVYFPLRQTLPAGVALLGGNMTFALRTSVPPRTLVNEVRRQVAAVDGTVPVHGVSTMEDVMGTALQTRRFSVQLMTGFAAVALLLAALGLYAVFAYSVAQRQHEIGVRIALGAAPRQIRAMMLREAGALVAGGWAAGAALTFAATRWLSGVLYGVSVSDPANSAAVTAILAVAALAAVYVPARRATQVDPLSVLRSE